MELLISISKEDYEKIKSLEQNITDYQTTIKIYQAVKDGKIIPEDSIEDFNNLDNSVKINGIETDLIIVNKNFITEELEKMVEYAQEASILRDNLYNNSTEYSVSMKDLINIVGKSISELKGMEEDKYDKKENVETCDINSKKVVNISLDEDELETLIYGLDHSFDGGLVEDTEEIDKLLRKLRNVEL